jgi:hypothetical protein
MSDERFAYAITVLESHIRDAVDALELNCCTLAFYNKRVDECRAAIAKLREPEKIACDIEALLSAPYTDHAAFVKAIRDAAKGKI